MTAATLPSRSPSPALPLLIVAACVIVAGIVISQHATQARPAEDQYSREQIFNILYGYSVQNDRSICKEVILASCPAEQQFKAGCRINGQSRETGLWLVGIIGTRYTEPVYITGIPMTYARFQSTMLRDGCQQADVMLLGGLLR